MASSSNGSGVAVYSNFTATASDASDAAAILNSVRNAAACLLLGTGGAMGDTDGERAADARSRTRVTDLFAGEAKRCAIAREVRAASAASRGVRGGDVSSIAMTLRCGSGGGSGEPVSIRAATTLRAQALAPPVGSELGVGARVGAIATLSPG